MCTDFLIVSEETNDKKLLVVNARSQEFDIPLGYRIILRKKDKEVVVTQPRKSAINSQNPLDEPHQISLGESKYNYMGIMMTKDRDPWTAVSNCIFDGFNEEGLSVGALNAPGSIYQTKEDRPGVKNVFVGFLTDWLLSQYTTCEQVKDAFVANQLRAIAETNDFIEEKDGVEQLVKLHFAVHDAKGKSLAIEFINGEAKITDNPIGVLTNLPELSWHLTNLGMYAYLSPYTTETPVKFKDVRNEVSYAYPGRLSPYPPNKEPDKWYTGIPGVGDGLAGIPGDFRPASRFVRTAYLKKFACLPKSPSDAVSQAFHLLNSVDIVKGAAMEQVKDAASKKNATPENHEEDTTRCEGEDNIRYDTTQIIVVKDLINKVLYVRMYESPMPYAVCFKDFDVLKENEGNKMGIQIEIPTSKLADVLMVKN